MLLNVYNVDMLLAKNKCNRFLQIYNVNNAINFVSYEVTIHFESNWLPEAEQYALECCLLLTN